MQTAEFPSSRAAARFVADARTEGYAARLVQMPPLLPRRSAWGVWIGALAGGSTGAIVGLLAETSVIGLPRLEPLFAAPFGAVTLLLAALIGSLGALIGALVTLRPAPSRLPQGTVAVAIGKEKSTGAEITGDDRLIHLLHANQGLLHARGGPAARPARQVPKTTAPAVQARMTPLHLSAWLLTVLTLGIILGALSYIWYLSINYGNGSDQQSRIGWTLKNVQRYPADTPEALGAAMATTFGGATFASPADPLTAAMLAPIAAAQNAVLIYGEGEAAQADAAMRALIADSNVAVVVADEQPAYALPAAYAAAHFRVPVVPLARVGDLLPASSERLLLVAAPRSLIANDALNGLAQYGLVERVAERNIYKHALLWARSRWGNFGWGIEENVWHDGYYNFTLANPADPGFAAAALPTAWLGNFGPLLYTPHDDLDVFTDQYLWRLGPDFFAIPSDGPFINVRVAGGPESVGYGAQARADLALETHAYRNQMAGAAGSAIGGWIWFFVGLAGAIWALFAMPRILPDSGFYAAPDMARRHVGAGAGGHPGLLRRLPSSPR